MAIKRKVLEVLKQRDQGLCAARGPDCLGEGLVPHHRANRGSGGSRSLDELSNLLLLCALCNGWVEDSHGAEREELIRRGVRLLPDSTHAKTAIRARETPVYYPDGKRWLLDDDGGKEIHDS